MRASENNFLRVAHFLVQAAQLAKPITTHWAAQRLEVSPAYVKRVIDRLRDDWHYPFCYLPAEHRWALPTNVPDFCIPAPNTQAEALVLAVALDAAPAQADPSIHKTLKSLRKRLGQQLQTDADGLKRLLQGFSADRTDQSQLHEPLFAQFLEAIAESRALRFTYARPWRDEPPKQKHTRPLHLRQLNATLYALCQEPDGYNIVFNLAFVSKLEFAEPLPRQTTDAQHIAEWLDSYGAFFQKATELCIALGGPSAVYFASERWHHSQRDELRDGILYRRMRATITREVVRKLISLGRDLLEVHPPELYALVLEELAAMQQSLAKPAAE